MLWLGLRRGESWVGVKGVDYFKWIRRDWKLEVN